MAVKNKDTTIEKITFKIDHQSIGHREIYKYKDLKIKLELESDGYDFQCYARAYVLDDLKWNLIYSIPHEQMKTKSGLIYAVPYRNDATAAEPEFKADVEMLKKYIAEIL